MKQLPPIGEETFHALVGLVDAGVRATGIRAAKQAAEIIDWMEGASEISSDPKNGVEDSSQTN